MRSLKERRNLSLFVDNMTLYIENNLADKSLELIKAFRYKINTQNQFCVYEPKRFENQVKNANYNSINIKYAGLNATKSVQKPHGDKVCLNKWRYRLGNIILL